MVSIYPACFFRENNQYSVIFPDLNWLATQGDSFQEAMEMAVDCLAGYLYSCQNDGEKVSPPSALSNISLEEIAKELDIDSPADGSFVNMVSVDVASYAKQHFAKSVKKTLSIPAWLNEQAVASVINFSQTLQEALTYKLQHR